MPTIVKTTSWKPKDFFALLHSLSEIPPHLYIVSPQQKASGQGIHFAVSQLPETLTKTKMHIPLKECWCNKNAKKPFVVLWKKKETKQKKQRDNMEEDTCTLIHDLVHRFTDPSLDMLSKEFFEVLEVRDFFEIQTRFPLKGSDFGLGARDVREFLSVASECYVEGKETFIKAYEKFLGEKKTDELYGFLGKFVFGR